MTPIEIIDLDELLGADKRVKLAGKVYRLPPDIPAELYLKIQRASREGVSDELMVEQLYDDVLELFRHGDAKIDSLPISLGQLMVAIGTIYGEKAAESEGERPTRRTRGGAASSKTARKTASRS